MPFHELERIDEIKEGLSFSINTAREQIYHAPNFGIFVVTVLVFVTICALGVFGILYFAPKVSLLVLELKFLFKSKYNFTILHL